ncbi:MAG: polynucleotide adenylyltransferase PcnB [Thermodesulfobacteriota bacterium]|nr:polynucleotide adenylyltransferase PcnB [Thermodesulfobacteriota bacterium]
MTRRAASGKEPIEEPEEIKPLVIPEGQHPVREQDIEQEALKVLYRLRDAGYSGYLVGGGVRDIYLGNRPKDFDISTNARPGQLRKLFRNSRTIGRRFRLVQVFFRGNKIIEVSTLRSRSEYDINDPDKVLPSNNTFGTLQEDAFRRDLTINSLFYEIENKTIIDYAGGVQDLDNGIIRIVGEPNRRITRDPVRMLRAIRHAARNDFAIEPETWKAIVKHRHKIDLCPPSRIRDELLKDLHTGNSRAWAEIALKSGIFTTLFPFYGELLAGKDGKAVKKELLAILAVLDRLYGEDVKEGKVVIADHMLFASLLFPWADRHFELTRQELKGPGYHHLSKAIRAELDDVFSHRLNLKRMAKDAITTLFVNMPGFQKHQKNKSWPAWLRRKSYFFDCSRFYALYQEASGRESMDVSQFVDKTVESKPPLRERKRGSGAGRRGGRRGTNPAFAADKKGVFGLLKG